jgi:outer membrane immunogenic protein
VHWGAIWLTEGIIMKKLLLAGISLTALVAGPATAADLGRPVYRPVVVAAPVYSWTGFYIGANAGYTGSRADVVTVLPTAGAVGAAIAAADSPSATGNGFTSGAQAGYNYQTGILVWGIEADINFFRTNASQAINTAIGGIPVTSNNSVNTDWMATVRPRIGVAVSRALFYATGGWAVTNASYNTSFTGGGVLETATASNTRSAWTVGGGLEYALLHNWSAKIEYLYLDFGHLSATGFVGPVPFNHDVHLTSNLVRAGLNYKFGYAAAPAVYK